MFWKFRKKKQIFSLLSRLFALITTVSGAEPSVTFVYEAEIPSHSQITEMRITKAISHTNIMKGWGSLLPTRSTPPMNFINPRSSADFFCIDNSSSLIFLQDDLFRPEYYLY